jgi:hypothetical protein
MLENLQELMRRPEVPVRGSGFERGLHLVVARTPATPVASMEIGTTLRRRSAAQCGSINNATLRRCPRMLSGSGFLHRTRRAGQTPDRE